MPMEAPALKIFFCRFLSNILEGDTRSKTSSKTILEITL